MQLTTSADSPGAWPRREAGSVPRPHPGTDKALRGRSLLHATRPSGVLEAREVLRAPSAATACAFTLRRSVLRFAALSSCTKFTSKETCANSLYRKSR